MELYGIPVPTLVNQIDDQTCGHACMAMITGRPIDEVISMVGPRAMVFDEERLFLAMHGVLTQYRDSNSPAFVCGVYLASAPSLNRPGKSHRCVVYADPADGQWNVLDPQNGREGRLFYTEFDGNVMAYSELTLVYRPAGIDLDRYTGGIHYAAR